MTSLLSFDFFSQLLIVTIPCMPVKHNTNYCSNSSPCFVFVDIRAELMPDVLPDRSEVTKFDHGKLKHVELTEKVVLPSKEGESRVSFTEST